MCSINLNFDCVLFTMLLIFALALKQAFCLDCLSSEASVKWMVGFSEDLLRGGFAPADQRTRQPCDILQLSLQTKHLTTKSLRQHLLLIYPPHSISRCCLIFTGVTICRDRGGRGRRSEGSSFGNPLVRGPDTVKNERLTQSELQQGWVNWPNLPG